MNLQLQGKKALVTGSTAGIGLSIALKLAAEDATVTVNGRTTQRVDEAVARIRSEYPAADVDGVAADLSTAEGAERVTSEYPSVDILVNNLGIFGAKPFAELSDEEWTTIFEANVMSGVRLTRNYFPKMLEQDWGRVIFVASESAIMIPPEMIHYGMTKSAQLAIARGLAEMTQGSDVTVNTVMPGPTRSEGIGPFIEDFARENDLHPDEAESVFMKQARPSSLLQRLIAPDEIANTVAFLASPLAAPINGAPIRVEGGLIRAMA